jgi:predicted permease
MSQYLQDLRYAARSLTRVPGFAAIAILTLALGIGANTAIFSVVNGVVLKPLPYPKPSQLVFITSQFPTLGFDQFWVSPPEFLEFGERNRSFQAVGAYTTSAVNIGASGQPVRIASGTVSASLFDALAVKPRMGRTFTQEETLPNASRTTVLSTEIWESAFGGDPAIVGKEVEIDGVKRTVVGVMPPGFDVHDQGVKIWLPLTLDPANRTQGRGSHFLYLVGRLRNGVTLESAKSELQTLLAQWPAANGATPNATPGQPGFVHTPSTTNHRIRFDDLQDDMIGGVRRALWVLQAAVALVLLIACANMANLLLIRAESRHKELAVRAALGAGRGRLMRQFMSESVLLSVAGGIAGLLLATWGVRTLLAANSGSIPRATAVGIDLTVLAFTVILAVGTGLLFGLAPLLHLSAQSVGLALRDSGSRTTASTARHRVRRGLVVAEIGLAVMLVVGAGLLLRSFWNLMAVDSGFDRKNLTTFNIVLPAVTYSDSMRRVAFFESLIGRLSAVPGVQAAAAMTGLPPRRQVNANDTQFEGYTPVQGGPPQNVDYYQFVTPDYASAMGIPVVEGRSFTAGDVSGATPVAMVNQTLAKLYYPGQSAIGRRLRPSGPGGPWFTIVGVMKDVKQGGVDQKTGTELYFSYPQTPASQGFAPRNMNVVLRSQLATASLGPSIRQAVSALDPALPVVGLRSMDAVFGDAVSRPRFLAQLLGVFATVALALAAIGTYGVLAYTVAERRREIGIRMALGARSEGVLAMVLRQGMSLAALGVGVGLAGALALTRLASTLLFGVRAADPVTFAVVSAFMLFVALIACAVPARRATKVDPLVALRQD